MVEKLEKHCVLYGDKKTWKFLGLSSIILVSGFVLLHWKISQFISRKKLNYVVFGWNSMGYYSSDAYSGCLSKALLSAKLIPTIKSGKWI